MADADLNGVTVDGDLVTSRKPDDMPAFNRELMALLARTRGQATQAVV